jgi:hypothetical protein
VNAAQEVADRLRAIAAEVESAAPKASVQALSRAAETMVKLTLSTGAHALGTPTPSPPGAPPALVSGNLRRGCQRTPALPSGPASWSQVLTNIAQNKGCFYGAVHEYGPVTIHVKNFAQLGNPAVGFFGKSVIIPRRPWMKPSVERLITSGLGARAAVAAFTGVIDI